MSMAGILSGTAVEVATAERMEDGDLLVGLITDVPSWVCMKAGPDADEVEANANGFGRFTVPMPPRHCLMSREDYEAARSVQT